jgi:hypothetical protein
MVNKIGKINEIDLYEDSSIEDNTILKGRKENFSTFIIASSKIIKIIYNSHLNKIRKEKLIKLANYDK